MATKTITVKDFLGMSGDLYSAGSGKFSIAKNFDTLTYPNRLFPTPSMQSATASTDVGMMIVGHDGNIYGLGTESGSSAPVIWRTTAGSPTWTELANTAVAGTAVYSLLVHYKENMVVSANRDLLYSYSGGIRAVRSDNVDTTQTDNALTYVTMCQGFVHPINNKMYFGYTTSSATYVGQNSSGTWSNTALTLPNKYKVVSITNWGNYLAIACTEQNSSGVFVGSSVDTSVVFLWDMVSTTWQEIIPWGANGLQVLNNLNGVLIGCSTVSSQTKSGFEIKGYVGGQPEIIEEFLINQTSASTTFNQRVNFINKNRLYFSVDLNGDGNEPIYKGMWSIGKALGRWVLNLEATATTDGSNASILSAVYNLDYLHTVHTAVGTLTTQYSGVTKSTHYTTASIYESVVNPDMPEVDKMAKKRLVSVTCHYLPLNADGQVIMKYRVDSDRGSWSSAIFTETTNGAVVTEMPKAGATEFTAGRNFEFRIESTGFAQIIGFTYKYEILPTLI